MVGRVFITTNAVHGVSVNRLRVVCPAVEQVVVTKWDPSIEQVTLESALPADVVTQYATGTGPYARCNIRFLVSYMGLFIASPSRCPLRRLPAPQWTANDDAAVAPCPVCPQAWPCTTLTSPWARTP